MCLCNDNIIKPKPQDTQRGVSKIYVFCRSRIQDRALLGWGIYLWEYTRKANFEIYLPPKNCWNFNEWLKEERCRSIVITNLKSVYAKTSSPDIYWRKRTDPFGAMTLEPWHPGVGTKPDCVIHLNCGDVRIHANCKTTRTWERPKQGTKVSLLFDELWLIADNSKNLLIGISQ